MVEGKRTRWCKERKTRVGVPPRRRVRSKIAVGGVGHVAPRRAVPAPSSRTPRVGSVPLQPPAQRPDRPGWLSLLVCRERDSIAPRYRGVQLRPVIPGVRGARARTEERSSSTKEDMPFASSPLPPLNKRYS